MVLQRLISYQAALVAGGLATAVLVGPSVALAEKDDGKDDEGKKKEKPYKGSKSDGLFDPTALERGAKALRDINQSPYAKQVGGACGRAACPCVPSKAHDVPHACSR